MENHDIPHINDQINVQEFVETYMIPNRPVVLGAHFTHDWPAREDWVTAEGNPDFVRLQELYGTATVQIAQCDAVYFSDQPRQDMQLSEFLDRWSEGNAHAMYCKDWHFTKSNLEYRAYAPLPHLSDDWLNMYSDFCSWATDDFRFCYMGGKGTWTPFHEDVYRSYSWSANICGIKHWILVPPGQNHLFTDPNTGNWVHDITNVDETRFPNAKDAKRFYVVQRPGETVFVPSGWWHQVRNEGDTISINHNWANEFNLPCLYQRLKDDLAQVKHVLRDVTDMDGFEEHAQLVLRADSGTDYQAFFTFLAHMASLYMATSSSVQRELDCDPYFASAASIGRVLDQILLVLRKLQKDPAVALLAGSGPGKAIDKLINKIEAAR